jgi:hypothetical protein
VHLDGRVRSSLEEAQARQHTSHCGNARRARHAAPSLLGHAFKSSAVQCDDDGTGVHLRMGLSALHPNTAVPVKDPAMSCPCFEINLERRERGRLLHAGRAHEGPL